MPSSGQNLSSGNYGAKSDRTAMAGWVVFAAMIMVLVGGFTFIDGLVALINRGYYGSNYHLLVGNLQAWGWWNLIIGAIVALAGFSLFTGATWARVVGVILASLNAISQIVFIAVFPFWALIVITLDVVVIYALVVNQEVNPEVA
jgi:hypothetical protein